MTTWHEGRVIENRHWNERLCSLTAEVALPSFEAGQFVRVGLKNTGCDDMQIQARPYSLVNAPGENNMEIYFNQVPGGPLSCRLSKLKEGDSIWVADKAAGFLVMSHVPQGQYLWMLATGTAVGPFLSILKTPAPWQRFEKIVLVRGVQRTDELVYNALLDDLQRRYPEQLIRLDSVTQQESSGTINQRIPEAINSGQLEALTHISLQPATSRVMVCGNPAMVKDSIAALQRKGLDKHLQRKPGHILQEIYQ